MDRATDLVEEEGASEDEAAEGQPDVVVPEVAQRHERLSLSCVVMD
jgi:hypothetical protein